MFYNYNFYFPKGKLPLDNKIIRRESEVKSYYNLNNWPFAVDNSSDDRPHGLFHTYFFTPEDNCLSIHKNSLKVNYNITIEKPNRYYYYISAYQTRMALLSVWKTNYINSIKLLLPDDVKKDLDNDKCQLVIDHSLEGFSSASFKLVGWQNLFDEYLQKTIYVCCDFKLGLHNIVPTVYRNTWEKQISREVFSTKKLKESIKKRKQRKFKAICKNRLLRSHRLLLCNWLDKENLKNEINYSFGIVTHHGFNDGSRNFDSEALTDIIRNTSYHSKIPIPELINWINSHGEKNLWHESGRNLHINLASVIDNPLIEAYTDSYFEIVSETNFWKDTIFHSEKSFKPILMLQPFVIMGEQGIINTLRTFGYDVFDDFINHTYDKEIDHLKRFELLKTEIRRLISISHEEWADFLYNNYDRLLYNVKNLKQSSYRYNTIHDTKYNGQLLSFPADHKKI